MDFKRKSVFVLLDQENHQMRAICKNRHTALDAMEWLQKESFPPMYIYEMSIFNGNKKDWKIYNKGNWNTMGLKRY